ncbi:cysteine hydrolase [Thermococci archaeon]|nr:MAG: cysteine hydrolase [Thermococci archaeon]
MSKILIVVDMLNDFCRAETDLIGGGALAKSIVTDEYYARPIIPHIVERVAEYRESNNTIIWLCDAHDKDDKEFDRFPPHAIKNTWGARIIDELNPLQAAESKSELVIDKTRYSGFYDTPLDKIILLREHLNPEYEVCGVCTSICVMDTVGGLANRDCKTIVNVKGVADFDPNAHEQALVRMKNLYGADIIGG